VAISYGDMPLKFHTKLRVVGGLTGEDPKLADDAQWLILHRRTIAGRPRDVIVSNKIYNLLTKHANRYHAIPLEAIDTVFDNREDPDEHRYWSARLEEELEKYPGSGPVMLNVKIAK
jgi:hypothetical protein